MSVRTLSAHDHYRWLLLSGWFILFSTIFSYVIAAPLRPQAADGILMGLSMLAFVAYSAAMQRYWIALGLFIATVIAVAVITF